MKKVLLIILISTGLMADWVQCTTYPSGTICTDEDGKQTIIIKS